MEELRNLLGYLTLNECKEAQQLIKEKIKLLEERKRLADMLKH